MTDFHYIEALTSIKGVIHTRNTVEDIDKRDCGGIPSCPQYCIIENGQGWTGKCVSGQCVCSYSLPNHCT